MGQVERYGVIALCVVIFLILGIAVWGGDGQNVQGAQKKGDTVVAKKGEDTTSAKVEDVPDWFHMDPLRDTGGGADGVAPASTPGGDAEQRQNTFGGIRPIEGIEPQPGGEQLKPGATPNVALSRPYKIVDGDTLGEIARRELGSAQYVSAIQALNPGIDSRTLQIGH